MLILYLNVFESLMTSFEGKKSLLKIFFYKMHVYILSDELKVLLLENL